MALSSDPISFKTSFLQQNEAFSEIELNDKSKPVGKMHEIDLVEDEIWLLQCPKGMDIAELQNQKLKIPGRTSINSSETVAMEFIEGKEQHAFAYCNRKGQYDLRLLPVRGTIVVRDRLKATETVSAESAEVACPPAKRVPMPANIRIRHPLLGAQYKEKLETDISIAERLQRADELSSQVLKDSLQNGNKAIVKNSFEKSGKEIENISSIKISCVSEDDVEFVSEEKLTKSKKNKRKYRENNDESHNSNNSIGENKKSKRSKINEIVSDDLKWLQNI